MSQGDRMVPLTNDIMGQMLVQVVEVMIECGLVQRGAEAEETAERAMQVLAAQPWLLAASQALVKGVVRSACGLD